MPTSTRKKINIDVLRQTTRENSERIERERTEKRAQQEAKNRREAEKPARKMAREVIANLPEALEKAAAEGRNGQSVFQMRELVDHVAAEIITAHCEKQGLRVETKTTLPDDYGPGHDYLLVSW